MKNEMFEFSCLKIEKKNEFYRQKFLWNSFIESEKIENI